MKYGLIGEKLGHSYSKIIHELLIDSLYELKELSPGQLSLFLSEPPFLGINVTIPYKQTVLPFIDAIDDAAKAIGSINTIVNRNGKLHGYNTDYEGFRYLLDRHQINVSGSKVVILGSGGTSKTIQHVMLTSYAREIVVVSRSKQSLFDDSIIFATYQDLIHHIDADIVINTTPVGMYPHVDASPIDLSMFQAHTAIDVIYNPHRTTFLQQAMDLGMKAVGGLEMLVAQAVYASQYFHDIQYDISVIDKIYQQLVNEKLNIVLIGMPGCGKTTIAKELSKLTNKEFIDIDQRIVEQEKRSIADIFAKEKEAYFRRLESQVVNEVSQKNGCIISTGGGVIKEKQNIDSLRHNGILIYVDRDLHLLQLNNERPLSTSLHDNYELWKQRDPLYRKYSDYILPNNGSLHEAITKIQEVLYEITRH